MHSHVLKTNGLLSSNKTSTSSISGNVHSRKTFSDDWQWSTRDGGNGTETVAGNFYTTCNASASFDYFSWVNNAGVGSCFQYAGGTITTTVAGATTAILGQCQDIHMACDGAPLPVELIKFEVE